MVYHDSNNLTVFINGKDHTDSIPTGDHTVDTSSVKSTS
ncbi:hypothetical protein APHMUC_1184 [Anaplasma phagocytophilum str. ApMUC09]|uniref:Uncharacterized protein n=1 Tax=Anaplasma phagocytophilum str. ApMUC09 TaxID=1359152 RepID=A0A0F3N9S4_ANAPH|nr:hypothetical protein APHMUC_1184 [Anaplasma phagocytophilum str. ApMUC09]